MTLKHDIERELNENFVFEKDEIMEFVIAYNMPSWPKSLKSIKIDMIEQIIYDKLYWIRYYGCVEQDMINLSRFLVKECLFSCNIAQYAQKIPMIGRLIKIGKFPLVLHAMKKAAIEYVYYRKSLRSADEALGYAKYAYWNDILETLDTIL